VFCSTADDLPTLSPVHLLHGGRKRVAIAPWRARIRYGLQASRRQIFHLVWLTVLVTAIASPTSAHAEDVGTVTQPITVGTAVDPELQRQMGLVTVNGGCSGTLLNQFWVLTARHCVTTDGRLTAGVGGLGAGDRRGPEGASPSRRGSTSSR
jgi:Trypsin